MIVSRRLTLRASVVTFVLMTGAIIVAAAALFILLDPRTQAFWTARWDELSALVRSWLPGRSP